jgi:hypothetical protein
MIRGMQEMLAGAITVPTRYPPDISVEELEADHVVLKTAATPARPADGGRLASEVAGARSGR